MLLDNFFHLGFRVLRFVGAVKRRLHMICATRMHRVSLASVGSGTRFQGGVRFAEPSVVTIGQDCFFSTGMDVSAEVPGAPLIIENGVQINRYVHLDTTGGLTIGAGSMISEAAFIYTHDHGLDPRSSPAMLPKIVGPDVWIGMRAVILPGCRRIGHGAVIGAGAVVSRDVPDFAIVAGSPARVVGQREHLVSVAA